MEKSMEIEKRCQCPYCDVPVSAQAVLCGGCGARLRFCSECGHPVPRTVQQCPECGAKLEVVGEGLLD